MKANAWREFLQQQRDQHGKVLFTVTELAHVAGVSRAALNVELARLRKQAILVKYAHGLYGLPGAVSVETLVSAIDPHAYITGHYALYLHNLVTQVPTTVTCFTDRRSPRRENAARPSADSCSFAYAAACIVPCPKARSLRPLRRSAITCISRDAAASDPSRCSRSAICNASVRRTSRPFWPATRSRFRSTWNVYSSDYETLPRAAFRCGPKRVRLRSA